MSGHSKWSSIKRQKGVTDARRGQAFTKMANAITIAARAGGSDPETNFKLRLVVDAAKSLNMPKENIERAISRGAGGAKEGGQLAEVTYEGFGPGGVGVLVEVVTDNRQRSAQEVRSIFERNGGRLSGAGSVAHLFSPIGEITVRARDTFDSDKLLAAAAEAGADDIESGDGEAIIYCQPGNLEKVKEALTAKGLEVVDTKISRKPVSSINIDDEQKATAVISLVDKLDDLPDVQRVYANFDVPDVVLQKVSV